MSVETNQVDLKNLFSQGIESYFNKTPQNLKVIDTFLAFILVSGIVQFIYVVLVGTFPYNAFLAGFISTVGSFVLLVNLRIQSNETYAKETFSISPNRAFVEYSFCQVILLFLVANFLG